MGFTTRTAYQLIGAESTYGSGVTTNKDIGLIQNFPVDYKNNNQTIHGFSSMNPQQVISTKLSLDFSGEVIYQHGRLIEYLTGGTTTHNATSGDTRHTFVLGDNPPSFTMEDGDNFPSGTDVVHTLVGCRLKELTLMADLNSPVKMKYSGFAKNITAGSTASSSVISTLDPFIPQMITLSTGAASSEATVGECQSFEFTINNASGGDPAVYGFGSRVVSTAPMNTRTFTFKFKMAFANDTEFRLFLGGTTPASGTPAVDSLIFNCNNGVTLGSGRQDIYLNLDNAYYETYGRSKQVGEIIFQEFTGSADNIASFYSTDTITSGNW